MVILSSSTLFPFFTINIVLPLARTPSLYTPPDYHLYSFLHIFIYFRFLGKDSTLPTRTLVLAPSSERFCTLLILSYLPAPLAVQSPGSRFAVEPAPSVHRPHPSALVVPFFVAFLNLPSLYPWSGETPTCSVLTLWG